MLILSDPKSMTQLLQEECLIKLKEATLTTEDQSLNLIIS